MSTAIGTFTGGVAATVFSSLFGTGARRACIWHLPRMARIMWAFTRSTRWLPVARSRGQDVRTLAKVIRRGWVRVSGDHHEVQGFITRDGALIHALYVHPEARRQGRGAALIADAKMRAPRLELWTEQANVAAQEFYKKQGFIEAGRTSGQSNDEKLPDILYVWNRGDETHENEGGKSR